MGQNKDGCPDGACALSASNALPTVFLTTFTMNPLASLHNPKRRRFPVFALNLCFLLKTSVKQECLAVVPTCPIKMN